MCPPEALHGHDVPTVDPLLFHVFDIRGHALAWHRSWRSGTGKTLVGLLVARARASARLSSSPCSRYLPSRCASGPRTPSAPSLPRGLLGETVLGADASCRRRGYGVLLPSRRGEKRDVPDRARPHRSTEPRSAECPNCLAMLLVGAPAGGLSPAASVECRVHGSHDRCHPTGSEPVLRKRIRAGLSQEASSVSAGGTPRS